MNNYIKIAWRNLWRNKRRTLITLSSIFFGVILSTFTVSLQEGTYGSMINNIVKSYSGYIQIHDKDYWEDKTLYYSFQENKDLSEIISETPGVTLVTPRLESFALLSYGDKSQPTFITGIQPETEDQVTLLSRKIIKGEYLRPGDRGILIVEELANILNAGLNDTITLLSQGYYGSNEAANFRITGILKFPLPEMNRRFCFLDLRAAQEFYSADNMITSMVLMVNDYPDVKHVSRDLRSRLDPSFRAMSWDEMQPELVQLIRGDRAGGLVMIAILFAIIGFGILGTIIMMIAERKKELAIMVAVGMQKHKLGGILVAETVLMGFTGVLAGFIISIPLILLMKHNPIVLTGDIAKTYLEMGFDPKMYFSAAPIVFIKQVLIVFGITLAVSIYPLISAFKLRIIKWMRG